MANAQPELVGVPGAPPAWMRDPRKGLLFAVLGTLGVATNFITVKYGTGGDDPNAGFNSDTFALVWASSAAVFAFLISAGRGKLHGLRIPRRSLASMALLGILTGIGMISGWASVRLLNESFAAFIFRFTPVLAIVLGTLVLGERLRGVELAAIAVMVAGGVFSTLGQWDVVGVGVLLALVSCTAGALQRLIAKLYAHDVESGALVFYRVGFASLTIAVWVLARGTASFAVPARYWIVAMLGAFIGPCLSFQFTFRAYRVWELARVSAIQTTQPLFVLPLALIVFGRLPGLQQLGGGMLILVGALVLAWVHGRAQQDEPVREEAPHDGQGED